MIKWFVRFYDIQSGCTKTADWDCEAHALIHQSILKDKYHIEAEIFRGILIETDQDLDA